MDASLPAAQSSAVSEQTSETTVSARQFYQNDLLLVVFKDKLHLNNLVIVGGIAGLAVIVLFVLFALAGIKVDPTGYYVRAVIQAFIVMPALGWIYVTLPGNIANLFNTLETNKVIGDLHPNSSGITSYGDFLKKLIAATDNFWWVAGAMTFAVLYWLYRLLLLDPLTRSAYPFWLQLADMVIYAPMLYSVLLTIIRLLVALLYTNRLFNLFDIQVNPLHPDGSAGLGFLENMLKISVYLTVFTGVGALVLNPAFLYFNTNIFSLVEAVVLAIVYAAMSLTFFIGWLLVPHQAMVNARDEVLKSLANEFQAAIVQTTPAANADANAIKAGTDRLSELNRRYQLLQNTYPTWPLEIVQMRRLIGTVSLPALIALLWPFISKLLPAITSGLNNLLALIHK